MGVTSSLSAALRAARAEVADRAQALGDLRDAEIARLELLRDRLAPLMDAVPPEADMFDLGLTLGEHPRLFIDMVAFVEMGRDRRSYRLIQDRRHGRAVLHDGDGVAGAAAAVTAYVARRLVEREQLLASLGGSAPSRPPTPRPRWGRPARLAFRAARLGLDGLGMAALGVIVWLGIHYAHGRLPSWPTGEGLFRP